MYRKTAIACGALAGGTYITLIVTDRYLKHRTRKHKQTTAWDLQDHTEKSNEQDDMLTLKSVQVFFRHGARTPLSHLPKVEEVSYDKSILMGVVPHAIVPYEVYNEETDGPRPRAFLDEKYQNVEFKGGCNAGTLTCTGKEQAYLMGKKLKNRYGSLLQLQETFNPQQVYVRSTNVNGTIETLQGVLGGWFGKHNFTEPVRIPVLPLHREFLFPQTRYCEPYSKIYKKVTDVEDDLNSVKEIVEKLNKIIGHDGNLNMMSWRDHLFARKVHGCSIPRFMLELAEEIDAGAVRILLSHTTGLNGEALKYSTGPMLDMIVRHIHDTAKPEHNKPRLYLYSGHDTTIVPLCVALGVFDNKWPAYCATIGIELWHRKDTEQDFVRILYCDQEKTPAGLSSPTMTIEEFEKLVEPYRMSLKEWHCECKIPDEDSIQDYERHPLKIDETIAPKSD